MLASPKTEDELNETSLLSLLQDCREKPLRPLEPHNRVSSRALNSFRHEVSMMLTGLELVATLALSEARVILT